MWTYIENGLPEPDLAVLAAWTNGDECHVTPSCFDKRNQQWQDFEANFSDEWSEFHVYAWQDWPEAPPVLANNISYCDVCPVCQFSRRRPGVHDVDEFYREDYPGG